MSNKGSIVDTYESHGREAAAIHTIEEATEFLRKGHDGAALQLLEWFRQVDTEAMNACTPG